jgi:hypothetical protein
MNAMTYWTLPVRTTSVVGVCLLGCLLCAAVGCQPDAKKPSGPAAENDIQVSDQAASAPAPVPVLEDDPAAVKQLEEAGFTLTKNKDGRVVGAAVDRREDASDLLLLLAGLPNLETLKLGGPELAIKDFNP